MCCTCMTCNTHTPGHSNTADEAWYLAETCPVLWVTVQSYSDVWGYSDRGGRGMEW